MAGTTTGNRRRPRRGTSSTGFLESTRLPPSAAGRPPRVGRTSRAAGARLPLMAAGSRSIPRPDRWPRSRCGRRRPTAPRVQAAPETRFRARAPPGPTNAALADATDPGSGRPSGPSQPRPVRLGPRRSLHFLPECDRTSHSCCSRELQSAASNTQMSRSVYRRRGAMDLPRNRAVFAYRVRIRRLKLRRSK